MGADPLQVQLAMRGRFARSLSPPPDERLDGARELVAELLELVAAARDRARAAARDRARMSEELTQARDQAEALEAEWHRSQRDLADARDEADSLESRWRRGERDLAAAREQLEADRHPDARPDAGRTRRGDLRDALAPAMGAGTAPRTPLRALLGTDDPSARR